MRVPPQNPNPGNINIYIVEDRDLDNKRVKLLHVWPTTIG